MLTPLATNQSNRIDIEQQGDTRIRAVEISPIAELRTLDSHLHRVDG
jgi:hypothetical protein